LPYVKTVWPDFIAGAHHTIMADAFDEVANGTLKRLIINMAPRHTKSEFASFLLPSYFLGRFPKKKIIQVSNTESLAAGFGRKVRNLIAGAETEVNEEGLTPFNELFPGVALAKDSQAAAEWATSKGGSYFAVGVNGKVTGKGADIAIVDDPHSEQEARQAETNPDIFDNVYEWYTSGIRQRLQPGGAIIIVMCMTGDTPVLRPDGSETLLQFLRPGDEVATYENGAITSARVANWQSNGVDDVYTIQTRSGRTLRANARHPFLVDLHGDRQWVRLQNLKPGLRLVSLKAAPGLHQLKHAPVFAGPAKPKPPTTEKTLTLRTDRSVSMENGKEFYAYNAESTQPRHAVCANFVTRNSTRHLFRHLRKIALAVSNIVMESLWPSTKTWSKREAIFATSADALLTPATHARTGAGSSASTMTTPPGTFAGCSATTATSLSATEKRQLPSNWPLPTFDVTTDEIVSVTPTGRAEVFDVEIEGTENFIANGVVSHNTRWSKRDLVGQVLKQQEKAEAEGLKFYDKWRVINLPAILDEGAPTERPMWPGFWSLEELQSTRTALPISKWKAQYQQEPTSEEGAIIKRESWKVWGDENTKCPGPQHAQAWRRGEPPKCDFVISSWDTAQKKTERSDYSAMTTWGVFQAEDPETGKAVSNLILLANYKARLEFPTLKQKVKQFYDEDQPDTLLVEDKGSGISLIQEFRAMGTPVENFSYGRGAKGVSNDKVARANLVSDIFASGYVWRPPLRSAEEVVEECAEFPYGEHDDYVDSVVQALLRFRSGGLIRTARDEEDEDVGAARFRRRRYY
jgi:predicted phage terminase large subunit-like protein